ncbi:MAG: hypothetical protein ABSA90_04100 [Xanthobacteraceae bacterium]
MPIERKRNPDKRSDIRGFAFSNNYNYPHIAAPTRATCYVCVARRPLCEKCLIADLCKWPGKITSSPAQRSLAGKGP